MAGATKGDTIDSSTRPTADSIDAALAASISESGDGVEGGAATGGKAAAVLQLLPLLAAFFLVVPGEQGIVSHIILNDRPFKGYIPRNMFCGAAES